MFIENGDFIHKLMIVFFDSSHENAAADTGCPSRRLNGFVFQNHLQSDITKPTSVKQPPALLDQDFLTVPNLNKPSIVEFLGLGGSEEAGIRFVDEVLNPRKSIALFENPIRDRERDLIRSAHPHDGGADSYLAWLNCLASGRWKNAVHRASVFVRV